MEYKIKPHFVHGHSSNAGISHLLVTTGIVTGIPMLTGSLSHLLVFTDIELYKHLHAHGIIISSCGHRHRYKRHLNHGIIILSHLSSQT